MKVFPTQLRKKCTVPLLLNTLFSQVSAPKSWK